LFPLISAHFRGIKPVSAVFLSYLLHVRERTWVAIIIDLTCRQSKTYSPLPRWLQISVANILVLGAGALVLPKSNQGVDQTANLWMALRD
ncbi:hypothetical protein T08_5175, partial [Trichinella sp. T8]